MCGYLLPTAQRPRHDFTCRSTRKGMSPVPAHFSHLVAWHAWHFLHLKLDLRGRCGTFGTFIDVRGSLATICLCNLHGCELVLRQIYAKYGRFGKDENSASFPKCVHEGDRQEMLDEILATLMRFNEEIVTSTFVFVCKKINRIDMKYQVDRNFDSWVQNGLWEIDPQHW